MMASFSLELMHSTEQNGSHFCIVAVVIVVHIVVVVTVVVVLGLCQIVNIWYVRFSFRFFFCSWHYSLSDRDVAS